MFVDTCNIISIINCHSQIFAGYPVFKGQVLGSCELNDIYEGLKVNNLLRYSHLLTGNSLIILLLYTGM